LSIVLSIQLPTYKLSILAMPRPVPCSMYFEMVFPSHKLRRMLSASPEDVGLRPVHSGFIVPADKACILSNEANAYIRSGKLHVLNDR